MMAVSLVKAVIVSPAKDPGGGGGGGRPGHALLRSKYSVKGI